MTGLHAAAWPALAVALAAVAAISGFAAVRDRWPPALEIIRRALLVVLVAQASIGLALAVRGGGPGELLHWIYGGVVIVALLVPGTVPDERPPAVRAWTMVAGSLIGAVLVWRLWASG